MASGVAGCGGLSEGMHQAGASDTKWAIEYWKPAADAFKMNNPDAQVYNGNCNVLLHRAMAKAGAQEQCDASESCISESAELDAGIVETLPLPGQVDFICGGPPCQVGYLWLSLKAVHAVHGLHIDVLVSQCPHATTDHLNAGLQWHE